MPTTTMKASKGTTLAPWKETTSKGGYFKLAVEGGGLWLVVLALAVLALAGASVVVTVVLHL